MRRMACASRGATDSTLILGLRLCGGQGDGIRDDERTQRRAVDALDRLARENAVRAAGVDFRRAALHQRLRALHDAAARIDHVVDHHATLARHVADDLHDLDFVGFGAALGDDGDGGFEVFGQGAGAGHAADIRRNHARIAVVQPFGNQMLGDQRPGVQMIDRQIEEALNLSGVQVEARTRLAPACVIRLATRRAVTGSRGLTFLSCRA